MSAPPLPALARSHRIHSVACIAATALLLVSIGAPTSVSAQETAADRDARVHFESGRLHYDRGAYEEADEEFRAAYELSHRAELLYNLYLTAERRGDFDAAVDYLERYLTEGAPDAERRASLEPRLVNLRERRARLTARGGAEEVATPAETDTTAPPSTTTSGDVVPAAVSFGIAGAGLVSFAIFGGLALAEDGSLESTCGVSCSDAQLSSLGTFTLVADISWVTAIAGAALGLVLFFTVGQPSGETPAVALAPWLGPDGTGLVAMGAF
jgi:tetratricopeptide (TPR) repeat protein